MAVTESPTTEVTPALRERLEQHRRHVAELREEFGDPSEALSAFMRERFDWQSVLAATESEVYDATPAPEGVDDSDAGSRP